jgi:hypothetical protein
MNNAPIALIEIGKAAGSNGAITIPLDEYLLRSKQPLIFAFTFKCRNNYPDLERGSC